MLEYTKHLINPLWHTGSWIPRAGTAQGSPLTPGEPAGSAGSAPDVYHAAARRGSLEAVATHRPSNAAYCADLLSPAVMTHPNVRAGFGADGAGPSAAFNSPLTPSPRAGGWGMLATDGYLETYGSNQKNLHLSSQVLVPPPPPGFLFLAVAKFMCMQQTGLVTYVVR